MSLEHAYLTRTLVYLTSIFRMVATTHWLDPSYIGMRASYGIGSVQLTRLEGESTWEASYESEGEGDNVSGTSESCSLSSK